MTGAFSVSLDLLREAASRRWFLAFGVAITLMLVLIGFSLQLEVVDGALAATRLFGDVVGGTVQPVDVALRPAFEASSWITFYGGLGFGILACADFGPSLLAPGRIEHLLALPLKRHELLLGTFLGVLVLAGLGALYGAGGLMLVLGVKSGVWTLRPLFAALLGSVAFSAIYAAMLATAVFVRSAALSAAVGGMALGLGIIAGYRRELAGLFEPGVARTGFDWITAVLPRVSALGTAAADLAASRPVDGWALSSLILGVLLFALAVLALALHRFDGRDY